MSTIFAKVINREIPAQIVYEDELCLAFRDINPQAPTHVLVIPKRHEPDVASLAAADPEATVDLITHTRRIADELGTGSYRLVFNTGADAFQTVFHCHGHVLSGRSLTWPPG